MPNSPRILGPQFAPAWHRPWFRYIDAVPGAEAGTPTDPATPAAPAAPAAPVDPAAPPAQANEQDDKTDWKAEARKWEGRAKENSAKAQKFDAAEQEKLSEIEKANLRATNAEQTAATNGAELLQLQAAIDNGITKAERVLLTATTKEALTAQVAAVLAMRAPSTASAKDAGITGGASSGVTKRAGSLAEAVGAQVKKN